jgi:tetratricopeptide (TPR) repeat protein
MDENDYLQKAKELIQSGEVKAALDTLKEASKLLPQSWQILLTAGQILSEVGHSEVAVSPLKKAKELNPDSFEIRFALGNALGRAFALREGLAELEVAETMQPNDDEVLRNLGWMRCLSGEVEKGRETLHRAIKIDPQNALIYNDLAASYLYTDDVDLDKAQDYCLRALEIAPGHPFFLQTWQNIQERLGEE